MTTSSRIIWRQEDRETPAQQAHRALHQAEAALQALWALYDTQLDPLRHRWPQMFGRVLGHLSQTILHAQTLFEAYDYFQARCLEAGIGPEDAAAAWDMHSSEAFEAEIVEAESVGPNALRMIDQTLLAKLGIAPHDARPGEAMRCVWQGAGLVAAPDICMPSRHARVGVWHPWCAAGRAGEGTGVLRKARSAGERPAPQKATGAQGRVEGMVTLCESHETGWSHSARSNHMTQEKMHGAIAQLETAGARVSVRQVHKMTGGSFRDVSRLLRALRLLLPTATVRSLELAIAAQARTVSVYRTMERNADARWQPQWAALLRQSETRLA